MSIKPLKKGILMALLCAVFCVSAQELTPQKKYDSISEILTKTRNKDSINTLLQLQKELASTSNNTQQLIAVAMKLADNAARGSAGKVQHLETAYALAEKTKDTSNLAKASVALASVFQIKNDYNKALFYVNNAIDLSKKIDDKNTLIEAYSTSANIKNNISLNADAIKDLNRAKKIALQFPDKEKKLIPILKTQSYIYYSSGQYEKGIAILDEIIDIYEISKKYRNSSIWRNNKAMIHLSCLCATIEEQKQNLLASIENSKKIKFNAGEAYANVHLSRVLMQENNMDSAYIYLQKQVRFHSEEERNVLVDT